MLKAFAPMLTTNETERGVPPVKLLAYTTGVEDEDKAGKNGRNLLGTGASAALYSNRLTQLANFRDAMKARREAATRAFLASPIAKAAQKLFHRALENWPIWVDGIWMARG